MGVTFCSSRKKEIYKEKQCLRLPSSVLCLPTWLCVTTLVPMTLSCMVELGRYDPVEHGEFLGDYQADQSVEEDRLLFVLSLLRCKRRCPRPRVCVNYGNFLIADYRCRRRPNNALAFCRRNCRSRCVPSPRTPGAFICV